MHSACHKFPLYSTSEQSSYPSSPIGQLIPQRMQAANATLIPDSLLTTTWELLEWRNQIYRDWNTPFTFFRTYLYVTFETFIGGTLLYFALATTSYLIFFKFFKKKFLPNLDLSTLDPVTEIKW